MKKKNEYGAEVAQERFLELLQNWMEEAEALGKRNMGNVRVRASCHALFSAFEAVFEAVTKEEDVVVFVARQTSLPDYTNNDEAYGDAPF